MSRLLTSTVSPARRATWCSARCSISGLPLDGLRAALGSLAIEYGSVSAERVLRAGVSATKFRVHERRRRSRGGDEHGASTAAHHHRHDHGTTATTGTTTITSTGMHHHEPHHSLKAIAGFIERSALTRRGQGPRDAAVPPARRGRSRDPRRCRSSRSTCTRSARSTRSSTSSAPCTRMDWLGVGRIVASPLNVGGGTVQCAHGDFPGAGAGDGAAAAGVPVYAGAVAAELVTPTGALLVTDYADALRPAAGDARRADRLRRRRSRLPGTRRTCCAS